MLSITAKSVLDFFLFLKLLDHKMLRPLFNRNSSWDPLQDWPKSSILDQCMGAPFFLEKDDSSSWLNAARKTSSWPGFLSFPLVTSICPEVSSSPRNGQQSFSQVNCDSKTWRITLDVSHFCPEEIAVKINEGYLEIEGMSCTLHLYKKS